MTKDLNDHYGVTISQKQAGPSFVAVGEIYSRKTMKNVGIRVRGEARTWVAAANQALRQAHAECPEAPAE